MNRSIKDATVKTHHYDDLESLKAQVLAFVTAHNFELWGTACLFLAATLRFRLECGGGRGAVRAA
jgi:hypothetical protein